MGVGAVPFARFGDTHRLCRRRAGRNLALRVVHTPIDRRRCRPFLKAYHEWLIGMLSFGPKLVTYEIRDPWRQQDELQYGRKLVGLSNHTQFVCCMKGSSTARSPSRTTKVFAGHGRAEKSDMIAAARAYGLDPKTSDEADALGLWAFTVNLRARAYDDRFRSASLAPGLSWRPREALPRRSRGGDGSDRPWP